MLVLKTLDPQPPEGWSPLPALMVRTDTWVLLLQLWGARPTCHTGHGPGASGWLLGPQLLTPLPSPGTIGCWTPPPVPMPGLSSLSLCHCETSPSPHSLWAHIPGRRRRQVRQG